MKAIEDIYHLRYSYEILLHISPNINAEILIQSQIKKVFFINLTFYNSQVSYLVYKSNTHKIYIYLYELQLLVGFSFMIYENDTKVEHFT